MTHEYYEINCLDLETWLVWDKSKAIPTPHYYKSEKAAMNKVKQILATKE